MNEYKFIHIAGWTKGGTTFCKRCFITFRDTWVAPSEPSPDYVVPSEITAKNIVVKHPGGGHHIQEWLERGARVMYLIRDPRDKIASGWSPEDKNMYKGDRLIMSSGQQLFSPDQQLFEYIRDFDDLKQDSLIIRYEDLCRKPNEVQQILASYFDLEIERPLTELHTIPWDFETYHWSNTPLRGINQRDPMRPPDPSAIGQWRGRACETYVREFVTLPAVGGFMDRFYPEDEDGSLLVADPRNSG